MLLLKKIMLFVGSYLPVLQDNTFLITDKSFIHLYAFLPFFFPITLSFFHFPCLFSFSFFLRFLFLFFFFFFFFSFSFSFSFLFLIIILILILILFLFLSFSLFSF